MKKVGRIKIRSTATPVGRKSIRIKTTINTGHGTKTKTKTIHV